MSCPPVVAMSGGPIAAIGLGRGRDRRTQVRTNADTMPSVSDEYVRSLWTVVCDDSATSGDVEQFLSLCSSDGAAEINFRRVQQYVRFQVLSFRLRCWWPSGFFMRGESESFDF